MALLLALFSAGSPLLAEPPVRITIPGTAFSQERVGAKAAFENVGSGRRFRGNGLNVILQATIKLPPPSSADPKLERLALHFRSKNRDASVRSVEVRNGSSAAFHLETHLEGDYTTRENTQPAVVANAWVLKPPISVSSQSVIRLEVQFSGGIEGGAASDILITGVTIDFPSKAKPVPSTPVPSKPVPSTPISSTPIPSTPIPSTPVPSTSVPTKPQSQTQISSPDDVIYAQTADNQLLWHSHSGRKDGSSRWATPEPKKVGRGWNFKQVFAGGDGVIYGINDSGDLLWFRHDGRNDGSFNWASGSGKKISSGWNFKQVFPGEGGVIYAITDSDELLWFRHEGRNDGSDKWAAPEGKKIGTGWNYKQVFSGGRGVIYAITDSGELLWFRHDGIRDGSDRWAAPEGKNVGTGWSFKQVFPGAGGVIYAINDSDELLWYRHDGSGDGSLKWAAMQGKRVGSGWNFPHVFCAELLER